MVQWNLFGAGGFNIKQLAELPIHKAQSQGLVLLVALHRGEKLIIGFRLLHPVQ